MDLKLTASDDELYNNFFNLRTPEDVADLLEIDYSHLIYHLYIERRYKQVYTIFSIPKRSGGTRRISAPITALKILQQKLNYILQQVYQPKPSTHGFVLGRSIVTNAKMHSKQRYVFNVDLKDFFPSINFGRVRGLLMARPYELDPRAATVLAQICCFNNKLPQGAPTSPIVSNMICAKMDSQLQRLAKKHRCLYSRYADDITFSTSMPTFPKAIARTNTAGQIEVGDELFRVITENGFTVNSNKIRLQPRNHRQEVTGLTTNQFPNVKRKYIRQVRAMLYAWNEHGLKNAEREFFARYDKKHRNPNNDKLLFKQVVKGKIEYIGMVRGKDDHIYRRFRKQLRKLAPDLVNDLRENPTAHLLEKYNKLTKLKDPQRRGYLLQDLMNETFNFHGVRVSSSFTRNQGSEQIDGAFSLDGWFYIVECRWRKKLADIRELDGLYGQVNRSGKQTMGFFLSINGWSDNVPSMLKQNRDKCVILMNGDDLQHCLSGEIDLVNFIRQKIEKLNFVSEPFYGATEYLRDNMNP